MVNLVTNKSQLEILPGTVRGPLRENQVAEAAAAADLGGLVQFDGAGKIIAATVTGAPVHVVYRNNGFKESYAIGDSVNIMNKGIVYLKVKSGVTVVHGAKLQVGDNSNEVTNHTSTNTVVGYAQGDMTSNGLVAVQL